MVRQSVLFEAGPMMDRNKTGVGYYVDHLVTHLSKIYPDKLDLTGYYFNFLNRHGNKAPLESRLRFYKIWLVPGKLLSLFRRLGFQPFLELFIPKQSDVVMFTNYVALPLLRKRKIVLIVYDLSFLDVPEFTQSVNLAYMRRFCPPSIRKADIIITISQFTKQRIQHHFPDLKAPIIVTPIPPVDQGTKEQALTGRLTAAGIEARNYILYLGTIEPRKNLQTLLKAYALLDESVRKQYSLVLAGGKGWKDDEILDELRAQTADGMNIIKTGYITDQEKAALYANAACFVLPSRYEGFGMPILEAMQHRIPVVVSDIPVFHEVAGGAALYFNEDSAKDIADKLGMVLNDNDLRQKLADSSKSHLQTFSWQENAKKVYEALR